MQGKKLSDMFGSVLTHLLFIAFSKERFVFFPYDVKDKALQIENIVNSEHALKHTKLHERPVINHTTSIVYDFLPLSFWSQVL